MKFKSLFLGMLGAAAIVSCNNDVIDSPSVDNGSGNVVEGIPVYASLSINAGAMVGTYAGGNEVTTSSREALVKDVAMYIYKSDASGFVPECAVYVADIASDKVVTMRSTSGKKKIFVAANPRTNLTTTSLVETVTSASSANLAVGFLLNDTLFSTGAATIGKGVPTTAAGTKADGLIAHFANGSIYGDGVATTFVNGSANPLMTNWDGRIDELDGGGTPYDGNASFTLYPDIDSVSSRTDANNAITINVQRQYAKISLKFGSIAKTSGLTVPGGMNLSTDGYAAAVGQSQEGRFIPWGSATTYRWSLGNIPTAQVPFQQFDANNAQAVRDVFYTRTDDSLQFAATKSPNPAGYANWVKRYDNTRVFPSSMTSYPMPSMTVSQVRTTMNSGTGNTANYTEMTTTGATDPTSAAYKYAYATESARQHPVLKDHQMYAIVGGLYQPKSVIKNIIRRAIPENGTDPAIVFDNYTWTPAANDTLYYVASDRVFISSWKTLLAYYAWVGKKADIYAGGTGGGTVDSETLNPGDYDAAVINAINVDRVDDNLYAYFEGQCWYRIYLQNDAAVDPSQKVSILRNHIYDVTITAIKGPGIADPNDIIIPGEPVLELDTYVSATVNVLKWHRVTQGVDVDNQ